MRCAAFLLSWALAVPAFAQLFDDNEARRRVELLRQQVEAHRKATDERISKAEAAAASAADRSALLDIANQIESRLAGASGHDIGAGTAARARLKIATSSLCRSPILAFTT